MKKKVERMITARRKWLAENSIEDWNDDDTKYIALQVAKLSFDAGMARSKDYYNSGKRGLEMKTTDKEQFIKELFDTSKQETK